MLFVTPGDILLRFPCDMSCFLALVSNTVTMVYWTLRDFMFVIWVVRWRGINVSFVVVVGASASALGDRRVCVEVVSFVSPVRITSSRYVCLGMTSRDVNMLLWLKEE